MPRTRRDVSRPQTTLVDRVWMAGLLLLAFADVILVLYVLPLFD